MPAANIEKAIKRGTGELPGVSYEEAVYEGYGPGGVALILEVLTDNKNRTVAELRHILSKYGGNLGVSGSVAFLFDRKGLISFSEDNDFDQIFEIALEAGAEDVKDEGDAIEVFTEPGDFIEVREAMAEAGLQWETAEISMIPQNQVQLEGKQAESMLKMMDALEDNDDVQNVLFQSGTLFW